MDYRRELTDASLGIQHDCTARQSGDDGAWRGSDARQWCYEDNRSSYHGLFATDLLINTCSPPSHSI